MIERWPGLTSAEAAARLRAAGPSRLVVARPLAALGALAHALADPMAVMLAVTGALYLVLGETRDGVVLLVSLIPVLGVDVVLEARSRAALARLAAAVAARAHVIRDGVEIEVPHEELVVGDVVVLREGGVLPADGVVHWASNLAVDESQLTGEAEPCAKEPDGRFFAGSVVLAGQGRGEITATGARTEYGRIATLVAEAQGELTPLQRKIERLVKGLGLVAGALAAAMFAIRLVGGAGWQAAFLSAVSLAMAAIPEEFPLVFTLFLSLGAWRLARRGVLVRRLVSVETLGATTVICTDKTGTLTAGQLDLDWHPPLAPGLTEAQLLEAAALACEPRPDDPLERAILGHCQEHGVDVARLHAEMALVYDHPFEARGKHMTHVWRGRGGWRVVAKGAPEGVLEHCTLDAAARVAADAAIGGLAERGLRVLAVAGRASAEPCTGVRAEDERGLELYGLLGFGDPLRPEVPAMIAACRRAGIAVKMITGDHALTAHAIAAAAGLEPGAIVTGDELAALGPDARARRAAAASVFARVRPEQKLEIVDALARAGAVVAMTGDGINDAPALRRASIGVSMGRRATEVARAAADIVLLNDDLGALVATVEEGRTIYANIRRAFLFLIGFHVPIIALAVAVPLLGLPLLLLPVHLVWLELVVHPLSALAFEGEPAPRPVLDEPPRDPRAPILPRRAAVRSVLSGLLLTAGALALYAAHLDAGAGTARSVALAAVILGSVFMGWAERAGDEPWRRVAWPRRRRVWIVNALVVLSLPLLLFVPALATSLQLTPIGAGDGVLAVAVAFLSVAWRAGGR